MTVSHLVGMAITPAVVVVRGKVVPTIGGNEEGRVHELGRLVTRKGGIEA